MLFALAVVFFLEYQRLPEGINVSKDSRTPLASGFLVFFLVLIVIFIVSTFISLDYSWERAFVYFWILDWLIPFIPSLLFFVIFLRKKQRSVPLTLYSLRLFLLLEFTFLMVLRLVLRLDNLDVQDLLIYPTLLVFVHSLLILFVYPWIHSNTLLDTLLRAVAFVILLSFAAFVQSSIYLRAWGLGYSLFAFMGLATFCLRFFVEISRGRTEAWLAVFSWFRQETVESK